jgi:hypothetical protein
MSRSNPNSELSSPCQKWFKWKGSDGALCYYDKEQKTDVEIPTPFTFIYLDQLHTIKGFSESDKEGIYSNEVRDLKTQPIIMKIGKHEHTRGFYADIKDKAKSKGGKYCQSVYIAFKDGDNLAIGNISFMGSSLSGGTHVIGKGKEAQEIPVDGWLEFAKGKQNDLTSKAVVMDKDERICSKGATKFYSPKFKFTEIKESTNAQAIELDKQLQEYLGQYLSKKVEAKQEEEVFQGNTPAQVIEIYEQTTGILEPKTLSSDTEDDDLPF